MAYDKIHVQNRRALGINMDWIQFCNESTYNPHVSEDTNNHVLIAKSISHTCFPHLGS